MTCMWRYGIATLVTRLMEAKTNNGHSQNVYGDICERILELDTKEMIENIRGPVAYWAVDDALRGGGR